MNVDRARTIYSNYNLWNDYAETARKACTEDGIELTEYNIWTEIYRMDFDYWDCVRKQLAKFFQGANWLLHGYVTRWDGKYKAGLVFTSFWEMFQKATADCDYVHLFEQGNRMFLECSHHDGTNFYEIRKITEKGGGYLTRWENSCNSKRTLCYVHDKLKRYYTTAPRYLEYLESGG